MLLTVVQNATIHGRVSEFGASMTLITLGFASHSLWGFPKWHIEVIIIRSHSMGGFSVYSVRKFAFS